MSLNNEEKNPSRESGKVGNTANLSLHIKVRPTGKKRFDFLSSNGGLNHLRVHAAIFTAERADQVMSEIRQEHGDLYELSTVAA